MATTNLFDTAKKSAPKKSTKKTEKRAVQLKGRNAKDLDRLVELNDEINDLQSEADVLQSSLKSHAIKEFVNIYDKEGKNPGSFNLESNNSEFMFLPTDRYIKIDAERAEELKESYGDEIVTEETTFTMDSKIVAKYGQEISDAIMNSELPDEVKEKLISASTAYSVAKGTITKATDFDAKVAHVIEDIKPVYQMKNVKAKSAE